MRFLFIHAWRGFSLAEWYLRDVLANACSEPVEFMTYDMPTDGIPINDTLPRILATYKPDLVGFSCHYWSIGEFLEAAKWVKHLRPSCRVVLGGPHVNSEGMASQILGNHRDVDFILRGAVHDSICRLVESVGGNGDVGAISGLSHRKTGMVRHNPSLPTPHRRMAPIFSRRNSELTSHLSFAREASYETVIGCRARCAYCVYPTGNFEMIEDELVEAELAYLCSFEVPFIRICDAHFAGSKKRAKRFLQHLAKVNRRSSIKIYPDTKHVDPEYVRLLEESGADITSIGVQTTNPESLDAIRRHSVEDGREAVRLILQSFPLTPADCIVGLPHDTPEAVERTFRDVLDIGFARVNPFRLHFFPGTSLGDTPSEFLDPSTMTTTRTGQLLSSSSFPVESLERVANLVHTLQIVCPLLLAREWLAEHGRASRLMDVASQLSSTRLLDLYSWMTADSPVPLLRKFHEVVGSLCQCLGDEPPLAERIARDLVEYMRTSSAERQQRDVVWGPEGRRVRQVVVTMPAGDLAIWDLAKREVRYRRAAEDHSDPSILFIPKLEASGGARTGVPAAETSPC